MKWILRSIILTVIMTVFSAQAEDETPEELKGLEIEVKKAQLEAELAEAESKKAHAFKGDDVKPPDGTITADDKVKIGATILVYSEINKISDQIATDIIPNLRGKSVIITNTMPNLKGEGLYFQMASTQLELLEQSFTRASKELPKPDFFLPALAAGSDAIKSVVSLLTMLRSNTTVKGVEVSADDSFLTASLSRELLAYPREIVTTEMVNGQKIKRITHTKITPIVPALIPLISSSLLEQVKQATQVRSEAEQRITYVTDILAKIKKAEETLKAAKAEDKPKAQTALDSLLEEKESLGLNKPVVKTAYEDGLKSLTAFDELLKSFKTETSPFFLPGLLQMEAMNTNMKAGTLILYVHIVTAGGDNKTSQYLLYNTLRHSGGAVVVYHLVEPIYPGSGSNSTTPNQPLKYEIAQSGSYYTLNGYKKLANQSGDIPQNLTTIEPKRGKSNYQSKQSRPEVASK